MRLTLKEQERVLLYGIAEIARKRWKRGWRLNYIEASAIICDELLERARRGEETLADLVKCGSEIISLEDVMEGTEDLLPVIQLEALFRDGTKLLTIHNPIRAVKKTDVRQDLITLES